MWRPIPNSHRIRISPHRLDSTPLFNRSGKFLGVLSTHFRRPHRPPLRQLRFTDLYARYAADIIERERLQASRRQVEEALQISQAELARILKADNYGRAGSVHSP
jgi:GAF domain-containing protein